MGKLILKDNSEIELENGSFLGYMTAYISSYADFAPSALIGHYFEVAGE